MLRGSALSYQPLSFDCIHLLDESDFNNDNTIDDDCNTFASFWNGKCDSFVFQKRWPKCLVFFLNNQGGRGHWADVFYTSPQSFIVIFSYLLA